VSENNIRCTLEELPKLIQQRLDNIQKAVNVGMRWTAEDAVPIVSEAAPKAFGDLRDSVHAVPGAVPKLVVDAPHAAAVEVGSSPHTPDIEALIAWVKLRGMQYQRGLNKISSRRDGPTTKYQAAKIGRQLNAKVIRAFNLDGVGPGGGKGRVSPIDAPTELALEIAHAIETYGTPPHWFVRGSLPAIAKILDRDIRKALKAL